MRETTEVRAVITSATMTAADIEATIGLKGDESWRLGDARGTFKNIERYHGLIVESQAPLLPLNEQLKALIKRLAPAAVKLGQLAPQVRTQVMCQLKRKQVPPFSFERDDLRWLAAMGAGLEIDINVEAPPPAPAKTPGAGEKPSSTGF